MCVPADESERTKRRLYLERLIMILENVKAVAFDGFSTLFSVPTMSPVEKVWLYLRQFYPDLKKSDLESAYAQYQRYHDCGVSDSFERLFDICTMVGIEIDEHHLGRIKILELMACIENVEVFPGAYNTIHELWDRGYETAIVSNASEVGKILEELLQFHHYVNHMLLSCDLHYTKEKDADGRPSDFMFEELLRRVELDPREILFVDDSIATMLHAKQFGFQTALAIQGEVHDRVDVNRDYGQNITITALPQLLEYLPLLAA